MTSLEVTTGENLRTFRLRRGVLSCPICGRMHAGAMLRKLTLISLIVALVMIYFMFDFDNRLPGTRLAERRRKYVHEFTRMVAPVPAAPTPEVDDQALYMEVPRSAVVWNQSGPGTYLWEHPGGRIIRFVENSSWVALLDIWSDEGPIPFGAAAYDGVTGWLDMRAVHRMVMPSGKAWRVLSANGGYLYASPSGHPVRWLSAGTPLVELEVDAVNGWRAVRLLVGNSMGWIPVEQLNR